MSPEASVPDTSGKSRCGPGMRFDGDVSAIDSIHVRCEGKNDRNVFCRKLARVSSRSVRGPGQTGIDEPLAYVQPPGETFRQSLESLSHRRIGEPGQIDRKLLFQDESKIARERRTYQYKRPILWSNMIPTVTVLSCLTISS